MSIEMLTPLFTPTTQVSAGDSQHEVRLTVSDDVQAILHTDQHLLVINKTYDSGTVSYMLPLRQPQDIAGTPRPCPRRGNPELKGLPPTAVKTLSRLQSDWTVRRSTLDSPWLISRAITMLTSRTPQRIPPHDAVLSRLFHVDTTTLIDALINEGRNGPLLAALRNTDDL